MKIPCLLYLTILLVGLAFSTNTLVDGCQTCLAAPLHHSLKEHHRSQLQHQLLSSAEHLFSRELFSHSILRSHDGVLVTALRGMRQSIKRHPAVKPVMVLCAGAILSQRVFQGSPKIPFLLTSDNDKEGDNLEESDTKEEDAMDSKPMTAVMVGTIGIYKNYISPLLPPACRFLPTCSQCKWFLDIVVKCFIPLSSQIASYGISDGVQAIEEFGPAKGCILTAWRIMRCSPFGGKGYDPPKWPPVPYNYGSY